MQSQRTGQETVCKLLQISSMLCGAYKTKLLILTLLQLKSEERFVEQALRDSKHL